MNPSPGYGGYSTPPAGSVPPPSAPVVVPSPTYGNQGYANPGYANPGYANPGYTNPNPIGSGLGPPAAAFDGTIDPVSPDWDAYASPGSMPPPGLMSSDPYMQYGAPGAVAGGGVVGVSQNAYGTMKRLFQSAQFDYVWMPGNAEKEFGINDVELSATFMVPLTGNLETPFLVTPGFAVHYWAEPGGFEAAKGTHLPPRVYDAYLDTAWNPQFNPNVGAELGFRIGVYSDFKKVTEQSLRYTGTGMIVVQLRPDMKLKGGIWYLDRNRYQLLPTGGFIWAPNDTYQFDILFPNPKISRKLKTFGSSEWWVYMAGACGGGSWTIQQPAGDLRGLDYNDLRFSLGAEFDTPNQHSGQFEIGIAFDRELFHEKNDLFKLNSTVFIRGGLVY